MGYLQDKYTREYFTGRGSDGQPLDYGALGADEWRQGGIFHEIKNALTLVETKDKDVLEIGFGRGESARFLLSQGRVRNYIGVDFSTAALELSMQTLKGFSTDQYRLFCGDALQFLHSQAYIRAFDVVYMLDSIEHIPAVEVNQILPLLHRALRPSGFLVVDTPFYRVDEDLLAQDGVYIDESPSDKHHATRGMHCNKFTRERLHRETRAAGFTAVDDRVFAATRPSLVKSLVVRFAKRRWG